MTADSSATGPACDLCAGTGFRLVETAERSYRTRCDCWQKSERRRRLQASGIPDGLTHCTLESFDAMQAQQKRAVRVVRDFVDTYPLTGATGLLFHGPVGTGKTHLAIAIVQELTLKKGATALFLDFRKLLKTIQESWNAAFAGSEKQMLDRILGLDLLALDDLGAEKPSDWVRETIGYLINERYVRGKPVLITTNLKFDVAPGAERPKRTSRLLDVGPETLGERIGVAALSRLYEMCKPIDLGELPDFRKTVKLYGTDRFG